MIDITKKIFFLEKMFNLDDTVKFDFYFIENYFADNSKIFLVCALITLLINLTVYNFISVTIFPQISFNDQSAFPYLKSISSFNKDIGVGCI